MKELCKSCISYQMDPHMCWEKIREQDLCEFYTIRIDGEKSDPVNHPNHYAGQIEVIDYNRDKLTHEEFTGFCMGNVIKYVSRWRKKDGVQDLKKAAVYLQWAIENEEKKQP